MLSIYISSILLLGVCHWEVPCLWMLNVPLTGQDLVSYTSMPMAICLHCYPTTSCRCRVRRVFLSCSVTPPLPLSNHATFRVLKNRRGESVCRMDMIGDGITTRDELEMVGPLCQSICRVLTNLPHPAYLSSCNLNLSAGPDIVP